MSETQTLVELFETACDRHARRPALGRQQGGDFIWTTYEQLRESVARARQLLTQLGARPLDRIAVIADNSVEWATLCYATAGCGAAYVPMYTAQIPSEWIHILNDCGARICFCGTSRIYQQLIAHRDQLHTVHHILCTDASFEGNNGLHLPLARCTAASSPPSVPAPEQTAAIIYTSGTTGKPKGVVLSHSNITSNAITSGSLFPIGPTDRSLSFLPWAHAFGQTVDLHLLLGLGVAVAINDDVTNLLTNLTICRPTVLVAVPRIFNRIYDNVRRQMLRRPRPIARLFEAGVQAATRHSRGEALSLVDRVTHQLAERLLFVRIRERFGGNLRFAICGSAALSREVAEFVNALGIDLYEGYGLTEASPVVSANTPEARRFGTVGKPLPGVRIRIDRDASQDSDQGEILVRGPNVMQGYYGLAAETAEVLTADGELRTGDMGHLDADGYLVISGRLKEQYKLENGRYVVPTPIEERLRASPLIANCLVYGANRPHNIVLVVPDHEGIRQRCTDEGLDPIEDLEDPRVSRWLLQEVRELSRELRTFERPKRIVVCDQDFSIETGLLTPSLKPKRSEIVRRYQQQIDSSYGSNSDLG